MHYRDGASVGFYIFMHRYMYVDLNMLTLTIVKLLLCKVKGNKYPTLEERKTKQKKNLKQTKLQWLKMNTLRDINI